MRKLMFTADWCGACKVMKPIVEEIGGIEIIDVEEDTALTEQYGVMSLPAFIVDNNGDIKSNFGSMPKKMMRS